MDADVVVLVRVGDGDVRVDRNAGGGLVQVAKGDVGVARQVAGLVDMVTTTTHSWLLYKGGDRWVLVLLVAMVILCDVHLVVTGDKVVAGDNCCWSGCQVIKVVFCVSVVVEGVGGRAGDVPTIWPAKSNERDMRDAGGDCRKRRVQRVSSRFRQSKPQRERVFWTLYPGQQE